MDKCCEDTDRQMLRGYRWTNVARIQMDKCCKNDGTYTRCENCSRYIAGIILYTFGGDIYIYICIYICVCVCVCVYFEDTDRHIS